MKNVRAAMKRTIYDESGLQILQLLGIATVALLILSVLIQASPTFGTRISLEIYRDIRCLSIDAGCGNGPIDAARDLLPEGHEIGVDPDAPLFYSVPSENGGEVWVSVEGVIQDDFASIVDSAVADGEDVTILTGTHGDTQGDLAPERDFFDEDNAEWGHQPNVNVVDVTTLTPQQLENIVNGPDVVVCAWCYSERSEDILDVWTPPPPINNP